MALTKRVRSGARKVETVTIGKAELIEHYSLLIPKDTTARIPAEVRGWTFGLEVKFDNAAGEEVDCRVVPQGDTATITFINWNRKLGAAFVEPMELATLKDGSKVLLMASNSAIGTTNRLDLQLLLQDVVTNNVG